MTNSMSGKTCVVTGANTGIGRVCATELARMGARVVLACRSQDKTAPVVEAIVAETGNEAVEFLALDLGDLAGVRRATDELLERVDAIHVLLNNAGLAGSRGQTKDGFELAFGVNHLGHFLWTTRLLDCIRGSGNARIVNVASKAHYQAKAIDWDALTKPTQTRTGLREYAVSKVSNVLFTKELARRLEGTDVTTYSLHPGVIASDIWRKVPWPLRPILTKFMITVEEGAKTSLYCATSPDVADETGLYYDESAQKKPSRLSRDEALAAELWSRSEAWVAPFAD